MNTPERPRMVYGVQVANYYEGSGLVEAVFTSEAVACEYARRRSADKYANSGDVTRWELDNPDQRSWLASYRDGRQTHHNAKAAPHRQGM